MQVVVSHPTGNRNVRAIIDGMFRAQMLAEFNTTLATNPDSSFLKILPAALQNELLRRTFSLPIHKICSHPWWELARMALPKIGLKHFAEHEHKFASIDAVYKKLDQATSGRLRQISSKENVSAVYAYEDGALATFTKAKELGLKCIYDLPIAFWETGKRLMTEEAERLPNWACTLGGGIKHTPKKLERKTKEMELADMIVVPGEFVKNYLPNWSKDKYVLTAPFGSPQMKTTTNENKKTEQVKGKVQNHPLRVLYVGSMGQRKGLGDLFAAMRLLNNPNIELVVMGSLLAPLEFYRREYPNFTYEPGRPYEQVLALMKTCDVFCLPSIVEGRALEMQEAMSQGLPLIITPNTGGADLIEEGKTGFLIPIRSPQAIANKLCWFLENRSQVLEMGQMAQRHAAKYTWDKYGLNVTTAIKKFLA
jgi:glycosyltransferase involved in cell wall biosynthesis